MSVNLLPPAFYTKNRRKIMTLLPSGSMAVLFSNEEMIRNGDHYYPYRQNSNFFFLTGIVQEKSILLLCPGHKNPAYREILFIRDYDPMTDLWEGVKLRPEEASAISGITSVRRISEFLKLLDEIAFICDEIFLDLWPVPKGGAMVSGAEQFGSLFLKARFPLHQYGRLAPLMQNLRLKKSPEELMAIRTACKLTGRAFDRILHFVKPGVWEYQVEAEMTHEFLSQGSRAHAFSPIVANGSNACSLHYTKNRSQCVDGDLLLMDFGAEIAFYASDCSRTIPVNGRFTPRQRALYDAVLRIYRRSFGMMVKGISLLQINRMLQTFWEEEHVGLGLYSMADLRKQDPAHPLYKKYFPHTVSHYIGLDVHDVGDREEPLEGGEVVSCEPGIYIPEEGIGLRLENTVLITQAEPIDLMADVPIEAEEIEMIMQKKE